MGRFYGLRCSCGYHKEVQVGHGMNEFNICRFPFYCEKCGLVTVNVSKADFKCPKCRTKKILPYGRKPVSESEDKVDLAQQEDFESITLYGSKHKCPKCKQMSLEVDCYGFFD